MQFSLGNLHSWMETRTLSSYLSFSSKWIAGYVWPESTKTPPDYQLLKAKDQEMVRKWALLLCDSNIGTNQLLVLVLSLLDCHLIVEDFAMSLHACIRRIACRIVQLCEADITRALIRIKVDNWSPWSSKMCQLVTMTPWSVKLTSHIDKSESSQLGQSDPQKWYHMFLSPEIIVMVSWT